MADPVVIVDDLPTGEVDVDMALEETEIANTQEDGANGDDGVNDELTQQADTPAKVTRFLDYLKSPVVEIIIGMGPDQTTLTAHQDLLTRSPYFEQQCAGFAAEGADRRVALPDQDLDAVGCFLEYLYVDEYFPKRIGDNHAGGLEEDPSIPQPDNAGDQLLRHARVYTLAEKLMLPELKSLAHSKIHRTTSTARGEIAYAKYVYEKTSADDATLRKPIAAFWAMRSHVLRHQAEEEFRAMCIQFPQFGFDVLTLVLDAREKKASSSSQEAFLDIGPTKTRKRARPS